MARRSVVIFAPPGDRHAEAVGAELIRRKVFGGSIDLSRAATDAVVIEPGASVRFGSVEITRDCTIWWRRTGLVPDVATMSELENRLRREEIESLVVGGLLSLDARWVDHPYHVAAAEHTLFQLAAAAEVGARVPRTMATNVPSAARRLSAGAPTVAKATSAGVGLTPFVDLVDEGLMGLLPAGLTLLQRRVESTADIRVVVVGDQTFVWRRTRRSNEPVDWRACDPRGMGFQPISEPGISGAATALSRRLSLSFCVQDWVEGENGYWFLEVNPVGQWLFLKCANTLVATALASHLIGVGDSVNSDKVDR